MVCVGERERARNYMINFVYGDMTACVWARNTPIHKHTLARTLMTRDRIRKAPSPAPRHCWFLSGGRSPKHHPLGHFQVAKTSNHSKAHPAQHARHWCREYPQQKIVGSSSENLQRTAKVLKRTRQTAPATDLEVGCEYYICSSRESRRCAFY